MGNAFASSLIKGFALTLAIGVIVSLFSAITVTRTFLRLAIGDAARARRSGSGPTTRPDAETPMSTRRRRRAWRSPMLDLVAKRNWFYLFSLADPHPGHRSRC